VKDIKELGDLQWYLSNGMSMFERSPIGAILDKLENAAHFSRKCRKCHGNGFTDEPYDVPDPRDPANKKITLPHGNWCPKCKGTGVEAVRMTALEQQEVESGEHTPHDQEGTRSAVPDEVLVRYASISRVLSRLSTKSRDAIIAAYGDNGEELARGTRGRSWALLPLTEQGEELIREARALGSSHEDWDPYRSTDYLELLATAKRSERTPKQTELLSAGIAVAEIMLRVAECEWDDTVERCRR
jgi:hypothetical protein